MYKTCPKCGYVRLPEDVASENECPDCGLIFSKWMRQRFRPVPEKIPLKTSGTVGALADRLKAILFYTKPDIEPTVFYPSALVFLGLFVWGWNFILMDYYAIADGYRIDYAAPEIYASFMHNVNLVFHEAGHIIFQPFGRFITILGGTLGQLLMPLIVLLVFLLKEHNPFGASVGLWWLGQSLLDVAPYINDARAGQIPLLGGGTGADKPGMHDWFNILGDLGWLNADHQIAAFVNTLGIALMLLSFAWGLLTLFKQYQNLKSF